MLYSGKITVFVLFSVVIHLAFALLFAEVVPSFSPPPVKGLSLALLTRGGGQGEIVQIEAAWPMPTRVEPVFSAERVLKGLDAETKEWAQFGLPDPSLLSPKETLVPRVEIAELAGKAHVGPPTEMFSQLPAESKAMPIADFALGSAFPGIFEGD